jgi:hypothetical protein
MSTVTVDNIVGNTTAKTVTVTVDVDNAYVLAGDLS